MHDDLYGFYPPTDPTNSIAAMRYAVHERLMATILLAVDSRLVFKVTSSQLAVKLAGQDAHVMFHSLMKYEPVPRIVGAQVNSLRKRGNGWEPYVQHFDEAGLTAAMAEVVESLQVLYENNRLEKRV